MTLGDLMFIIPAFEDINLVCLDCNFDYKFDRYCEWKDCKYMKCEVVSIRSGDYCLQIEIKVEG